MLFEQILREIRNLEGLAAIQQHSISNPLRLHPFLQLFKRMIQIQERFLEGILDRLNVTP